MSRSSQGAGATRLERMCLEELEPRRVLSADSVVTINEIMYHPSPAQGPLEWVEIYNQMAIDVELSDWYFDDAIDFRFPRGTKLAAGSYLVVARDPQALQETVGFGQALGPFRGNLSNGGERLVLRNHNGRLMDKVRYDDNGDWPVAADGSGATLAKVDPRTSSEDAANWVHSLQVNGTPGVENFPPADAPADGADTAPVTANRAERGDLVFNEYALRGTDQDFIELANYGVTDVNLSGMRIVTSQGESYSFDAQTIGAQRYFALSMDRLGFHLRDGDRLFLMADSGRYVVDGVELTGGDRGRSLQHGLRWQMPSVATPGAENSFVFEDAVVINEIMYHFRPTVAEDEVARRTALVQFDSRWRYNQSGVDLGPGWAGSAHVIGEGEWNEGQGVLGVPVVQPPKPVGTDLSLGPTTYYFETDFQFSGDISQVTALSLAHIVDDGAVFYLNGVELARVRMPFTSDASTYASAGIAVADRIDVLELPASGLVRGLNRLSVEVHQNTRNSPDVLMGVALEAVQTEKAGVEYRENDEEWIELFNRSEYAVDLSGWRLGDAVRFTFPGGTVLSPNEYLTVARNVAAFRQKYPQVPVTGSFRGRLSNKQDRIQLFDGFGNIADEVHYYDDNPWPSYADGFGASLELRDPWADNASPQAWAASRDDGKSRWEHVAYAGLGRAAAGSNEPSHFNEFIFGLLDEGELLIDNVSVIEDPGGSPRQLVQNGDFESGEADKWRILGNHRGSVETDPEDPTNRVLHVRASGPTEYLSNHAETTLKYGDSFIKIQDDLTYEVSFDAKWLGGSNQLNTRLFFNRLAKSTVLASPFHVGTPGMANSRWEPNMGPTFRELRHWPLQPRSGEPVTVSVSAEDPDGVAELTLWYAIDGGDFNEVAMTAVGASRHEGHIPGVNTGSTVQFYVEAEDFGRDGLVGRSMYPPRGPESRALYEVNAVSGQRSSLRRFQLIMTDADTAFQNDPVNVQSDERLGATVIYDGDVYYDVGVHLRGAEHGRFHPGRRGFNIRFAADGLFRDTHKTIALDRTDPPITSELELLAYLVVTQAGGLASMYNDLVYFDAPPGTSPGPAQLMMARYGDTFLDSQFEDGSEGNLYKYEIIYNLSLTDPGNPESSKFASDKSNVDNSVRSVLIRPIGQGTANDYRHYFQIANERQRDDYSTIRDLTAILSSRGERFQRMADARLDVDAWMRYFAVLQLITVDDNYATSSGSWHNLFLYDNPQTGLITPFVYDLDFHPFDIQTDRLLGALNFGNNRDLGDFLSHPAYKRLYYGHLVDIVSTVFNANYLRPWTAHLSSLLPGESRHFGAVPVFAAKRGSRMLETIRAEVPPVPFQITDGGGQRLVTSRRDVTLQGTGWVDIREIRLAGHDRPLEINWTDVDIWQATLPVNRGVNYLELQAYNRDGELVGSDSIAVYSDANMPVGQVVISEVHYNPPGDPGTASLKPNELTFIELYNKGDAFVDLSGWKLTGTIDFSFPAGAAIGPRESVVVVPFLPAEPAKRSEFQSQFQTGVSIPNLFGPFTGQLSKNDSTLRLERALNFAPETNTGPVHELADEVVYDSQPPWPVDANGAGHSLVRRSANHPGTTPSNWFDARPSPGGVEWDVVRPGDANGDGQFTPLDIVMAIEGGKYLADGPANWNEGDWNLDGVFDQRDLVLALSFGEFHALR